MVSMIPCNGKGKFFVLAEKSIVLGNCCCNIVCIRDVRAGTARWDGRVERKAAARELAAAFWTLNV